MKEKIIELFKKYEGAVDRSNYPEMAICEDNYNELAEDIVKLLATPAVSESEGLQGEALLLAYAEWREGFVLLSRQSPDMLVKEFLSQQ